MKKMTLALIASILFLPALSFAQTTLQPPASWIDFQQKEKVKIAAFFKEMKADTDAFLKANPDAKAYLDQMRANAKARMAAWRAAQQNKNTTNPSASPSTP